MKIHYEQNTLTITDVRELGSANSDFFRNEIGAALLPEAENLLIDLSQTRFMDCTGLGALISLCKTARSRNHHLAFQVVNPTAPVRYLLGLTRLNELFQIKLAA